MKKDEWIARCAHRYVEIAGVTLYEAYQAAYANFDSEDGVFDESDDHCPEACADADDAFISRFLQNDTAADEIDALRAQVAALTEDLAESDAIRDKCARLLAETAVALKGPEKALHRHGWQDLPEVASSLLARVAECEDGRAMSALADSNVQLHAATHRLTDALWKAREALQTFVSWAFDETIPTREAVEPAKEALAAIDGVLNQQEISRTVTGAGYQPVGGLGPAPGDE